MREFKKRRTASAEILRVALGGLGIVSLLVVAFMAARGAYNMYGTFASAAAARSSAEAQAAELELRHAKIEADVNELSSARGIEAAVRQRYGVALPGEGEITIVRSSSSTEVLRSEKGFFEGLWDILFVW